MKARPIKEGFDISDEDVAVLLRCLSLLQTVDLGGISPEELEGYRHQAETAIDKLHTHSTIFTAGEMTTIHIALQLTILEVQDPEKNYEDPLPPLEYLRRLQAEVEKAMA